MARQNKRFLKNMKTGVIFPFTVTLHENRPDLLECDENGTLTHTAGPAEQTAPFLLNPVTGAIVAYSPQMGTRLGWVPVQNSDHAEQVMADLGGSTVPSKPQGLKPPNEQLEDVSQAAEELGEAEHYLAGAKEEVAEEQSDFVKELQDLDISKMQRQALGKLVKDLDEELDVNEGDIAVVREQVQVLVNNKIQSMTQAA